MAINVAYLIPNGNVRMEVMGLDPRPARDDELRAMQKLVREGMDAGAVGLSTGLDYIPSRYADAREIAALCEPIVAENGVYVTHMRGYGPHAAVGMREVYEIARATGVPAHISHYNGPADLLLPLIDEGRALGLDLTFDTYPYLAGSTILGMVALPAWVQEGGIEPTVERLRDPAVRARLKSEWFSAPTPYPLENDHDRHGGEPRLAMGRGADRHRGGRSRRSCDPGDFVCEILSASGMAVGIVGFRPGDRTEADVRAILRHPAHMAGSDGIFCGGFPHPRGWGAFARYLGYHTRAARRLFLARGRHPPGDPRRAAVPPDRPGPDPPRLRRRHRRLRPGHRDRPIDLRRRPHPGRGGRSRAGQRHARPGKRRADRGHARAALRRG